MGRKFKVWLNSGANINSCRKQIVDLDDLGMSEEWDSMTEDDREEAMREIAFDRSDWGFCELELSAGRLIGRTVNRLSGCWRRSEVKSQVLRPQAEALRPPTTGRIGHNFGAEL